MIDEKAKHHVRLIWATKALEKIKGGSVLTPDEELDIILEAYESAREQPPKGEITLSLETLKQLGADPKVQDAVRNPANPFSVAWHKREDEHRQAIAVLQSPPHDTGIGKDDVELIKSILEVAEHLQVDNGLLTATEQYDLGEQLYVAINQFEAAMPRPATGAILDIFAERQRQIEKEGWSIEHDNAQTKGDLAVAGACYALQASGHISEQNITWRETYWNTAKKLWPWDNEWWKPKNARRDLVRAAALILAEIERLDRFTSMTAPEGE